ncbi:MAG: CBS domain-containing protein, partial [Anaerolineaceae bacterium]|nr:CBS domain-containing protein [Anaerolineaceae bacterium]
HDRAAGALLQPEDIGESSAGDSLTLVRQKLLDVLPRYILPSITVSQLMSRKPLVLSPKTSAQEAAELMKRYGYEGYPVVEDGTVIGLLTRRAVDRALAHKLNLTAGSLMDAGEVTVHPTDALEHLQKLMTSTGWGQVPVVDPQTNQLIGIVTRTDLLKVLAGGENHFPESQNLASRLEAALPAARLALLNAVANLAHSHHQAIYIVGGFVRDLLLDRPSLDFDIVVEGDAIALGEALVKKFGGKMTSHKRFGTAKWQLTGIISRLCQELPSRQPFHASDLPESLDLISARTEFYNYPTALPVVERGSIKLDLHRRDFTINTMALRLDGKHYGELYDYWGGLADLRRGLVRALHSLSFVDDPTRMLRAVRFEQRFGFNIENRTLQLMREAQPMLRQVSGQRLTHELNLILLEAQPADMLNRLQELGLLSAIHPLFNWKSEWKDVLQSALTQQPDPEWELPTSAGRLPLKLALAYLVWLASLPLNDSQAITNRLRLPSCLQEALASLNRLSALLPELAAAPISEIVSQLDKAPLIALYV